MGHRLEFHQGRCKNLHGHSYKMILSIEGTISNEKMVIDFFDLDSIVFPFIDDLDHSFICHKEDSILIDSLKLINSKMFIVDYFTTVENMARHFAEYFQNKLNSDKKFPNVKKISVKIFETSDSCAEYSKEIYYE